MAERGLPMVDGPVACPFVAFADERDERSTTPDHRHRCYAESTPAPRALAHQEAYCLSSAFPVCPTFQDWARREAATAQAREPAPVAGQAIPGLADERPTADADLEEPVYEDRPRRPNQRNWASPPPWVAGQPDPSGHPAGTSADAADAGLAAGAAGAAAAGAAAAGAAAASGGRTPGGGLSGSFADRLATPPEPPARQRTPVWRANDGWDDEIEPIDAGGTAEHGAASGAPAPEAAGMAGMAAAAAMAAGGSAGSGPLPDQAPAASSGERSGPMPGRRRERSDVGADDGGHGPDERYQGPSWERPARLETFPSLRSRRMPALGLPKVALAGIVILLASAFLFFLPGLLGLGSSPSGASPSPSSAAAASSAPASLEPTAIPAPTQQVYIVQSGDTMSKIAKKFSIPLQTLINANPQLKNPNVLKIGDQIIIPVPTASELPGSSPVTSP